jgi:alpha-D-ribose 1-methylphosphonate 5-triphosphate synthase subunit PhnL
VSLLRGLALPRRVLLLDEPTTGLDDDLGDIAINLIKDTCISEGTACLAIMHDRDRAQRLGLRSMEISDGVLKSDDFGSAA